MRSLDHFERELLVSMKKAASRVLATTPIGAHLTGAEFDLMRAVFSLHPEYVPEEDLITRIHVDWCPPEYGGKQKAFWLTLPTGLDSWSFHRCFDRNPETDIGRNARLEIEPSKNEKKFKSRRCECQGCERCQNSPCGRAFRDVHHAGCMTFAEILSQYLIIHGEDLTEFRQYHDSVATLQALCLPCHKAETKRNPRS